MKILYLGYKNCKLYEFLNKNSNLQQTEDKITVKDVKDIDYVISFGYKYILKEDIINACKNKIINLHISYLPYNRGANPNFWSFLDNTPKGVTIHYIDKGVDTGDILLQKKINFNKDEDTLSKTYDRLIEEIQDLFIDNFNSIITKEIISVPQTAKGTFYYKKDIKQHINLLIEGWDTKIDKISSLRLRIINFNDENLLLEWRNDIVTRENSISQEIVSKENHKKWLENTILYSPNTKTYILEDNSVPVGTIRSDELKKDVYEVSWTISPHHRKKGYGTKILRLFLLNKEGTFLARIMPINIGSIKMTEKNGFKLKSKSIDNKLLTYQKIQKRVKRTDLEIIDEVEQVRTKNNVNWMDILRLSFKHAPDEARKLMGKVNEHDGRISELLKELSNNE